MRKNVLRFIRRSAEFLPMEKVSDLPRNLRGIYVLYQEGKKVGRKRVFDLRYIGMSVTGIGGRLRSHRRAKRKKDEWTHFSVFEVWDNVTDTEISELEGLARHLYRFDSAARTINI